jgi:hypothetical protein
MHLTVFTFRAPMYNKSTVCSVHNAYVRPFAKTSTALLARSRMIGSSPPPPPRQQVVSRSRSSCVTPIGRGGGGGAKS